ncbi:MAG: T9SS type A sorting domain-containing protein, partial [Rhodothermia bacterium]|nr:T9SS type A sorting domain-containing protein [Rhodothermia bacterium]
GEGLGAVTLDFACLQCHTDKDVTWAADFASAVHSAGIVTGTEGDAELPSDFALGQNYPNPFNPSTTIEFALPQTSQVTITVYDATGRLIGTVVDNLMPAGQHSVTLQGDGLASGVYFYEMKAGNHEETKSMIVMK